jgi:hypothetical protein
LRRGSQAFGGASERPDKVAGFSYQNKQMEAYIGLIVRIQSVNRCDRLGKQRGADPMIERRLLVRHKTFIKGRIYFNNRLSSIDCIVRDVTANGARLEVSENVALPNSFELHFPNKDEHFHARVEWRKGNNLGVSWTPEPLAKPSTEDGGRTEHSITDRLSKLEHDVAVLQRRLNTLPEA